MIDLAHFGQKRLNLPIVVLLLVVYVAFSINAAQQLLAGSAIQAEIISDLASLPVDEMSGGTKVLIEEFLPESTFLWLLSYLITFWGVFLGAIGYLIYCYRRTRAKRS